MNKILWAVGALCLAGCGGGGSGAGSGTNGIPAVSTEGLWLGNILGGLVTSAGELWGLQVSGSSVSLVRAQVSGTGTSFSGSAAVYAPGTGVKTDATLAGTVVAKTAVTGTVTVAGTKTDFSAAYSTLYEQTPTLASAAGTYVTNNGGAVIVQSNGDVAGYDQGCAFTGTVAPDAGGKNYFRLTLKFVDSSSCLAPGGSGVGVMVPASSTLAYAGFTSGNVGAAYWMTKQTVQ